MGIFRFQRCLYHLTVYAGDLPPYPEVTSVQIKVLPLEAQQLSPPQAGGQLHVVELEYTTVPCFPQEGGQLLHRESFHLLVFQLGQGATLRRIAKNDPLLLGQF